MALNRTDIAELVQRHADGEDVVVLAKAYKVTVAAVRYWLKKDGELDEAAPVETSKMSAADDSDEALGIGEEDVAAVDNDLAALMANPALAKLIENAVAARLAQMGAPVQAAAQSTPQGEAFEAFTTTVKHLIDTQAMQQPGYVKPLPSEEVERRAAGYVEMTALLADCQTKGTPPLWTIGENGFFECTNALEFMEGEQIRTYLPPAEDFIPQNDEARAVHAAMMQWIGGPTPGIGEQVQAAMIAAKQAPLIDNVMAPVAKPGLVERVAAAPDAVAPTRRRRTMGSIVPERRDLSLAERVSGPVGPAFASEAA